MLAVVHVKMAIKDTVKAAHGVINLKILIP